MSVMTLKSCLNCGCELQDIQSLDGSSSVQTVDDEHYCPACGFRQSEALPNIEIGFNKSFRCVKCVKTFTHFSSLKRHVNSHSGARPFHCELCEKFFSTKAALKRHKIIHTGECPYECSTCKRKFNQISNLRKHLLIHSNNCPYYCNICGKGFNQLSNMKKHASVHVSNRTKELSRSKKIGHSAISKRLDKQVARPVLTFIRPADS